MSQPRLSVPNQWAALMPSRASPRSQLLASNGFTEVNSEGNTAMTTRTAMRTDAPMKSGRRRRSYQASPHRLAALGALAPFAPLLGLPCLGFPVCPPAGTRVSLIADPRVEH